MMDSSKVIITKRIFGSKKFSFENEIGLSSYDLALMSINKKVENSYFNLNESNNETYLI